MVCVATFSDIPELVRLINSAYRGDVNSTAWTSEKHLLDGDRMDEARLRLTLQMPDNLLLIRRNNAGQLVGNVQIEKQGTTCYLGLLSVAPHQQQGGLGRTMISEAETFARENWNCKTMRMTVIHQRTELIAYYVRRGYRISGETLPFAGKHIVGTPVDQDLYFDVLIKEL